MPLALGHQPTAILVEAAWSAPSLLERRLLTQVASEVAPCLEGGPCIRLVFLDADSPADARQLAAVGGTSVVPFAVLVDARGIVRQRYLGWPGRDPAAITSTLRRDFTRLLGTF